MTRWEKGARGTSTERRFDVSTLSTQQYPLLLEVPTLPLRPLVARRLRRVGGRYSESYLLSMTYSRSPLRSIYGGPAWAT